jgi:hypothetical protein
MFTFWWFFGLFIATIIWFEICNVMTYNQRMKILKNIVKNNTNYEITLNKFSEFNRISYYKHMMYLFLFKDATILYEDSLYEEAKINK